MSQPGLVVRYQLDLWHQQSPSGINSTRQWRVTQPVQRNIEGLKENVHPSDYIYNLLSLLPHFTTLFTHILPHFLLHYCFADLCHTSISIPLSFSSLLAGLCSLRFIFSSFSGDPTAWLTEAKPAWRQEQQVECMKLSRQSRTWENDGKIMAQRERPWRHETCTSFKWCFTKTSHLSSIIKKIYKKTHAGRVQASSARGDIPLCLLINPETEREPEADRKSTF